LQNPRPAGKNGGRTTVFPVSKSLPLISADLLAARGEKNSRQRPTPAKFCYLNKERERERERRRMEKYYYRITFSRISYFPAEKPFVETATFFSRSTVAFTRIARNFHVPRPF